jgi:antitoxin (DNA-binding transcriptional repressor) of toxin-antitoxin stability system
MKKANISEAKSKLSSYLNDVQRGETVLIFDRNRLFARLEPVTSADVPDADRVMALVRSGIASAPRGRPDVRAFLGRARPRLSHGASGSATVVRERREGR